MNDRTRVVAASGFTVAMFLLVQLGALALVEPFQAAGYQQVENPSDPTNSFVYVGAVLVLTAVMLAIIKLDVQWLLRAAIVLTSGMLSWYVFSVLAGGPLALALAGAVVLALVVHPEWYVIDAAGVIIGAGSAGLFGISFGLLPAILLLAALAVYDAISVYGTEHMLTLASGVMELRIPVVLVVPMSASYSFLDEAETDPAADGGQAGEDDAGEPADPDRPDVSDRDVFFIGLGDAVMPTVMVASAAFFAPPEPLVSGLALNLPALTAMVGTIAGLLVLLWMVMKGRAHAGLPLLNGGAIGGYLVGALASGMTLLQALGL